MQQAREPLGTERVAPCPYLLNLTAKPAPSQPRRHLCTLCDQNDWEIPYLLIAQHAALNQGVPEIAVRDEQARGIQSWMQPWPWALGSTAFHWLETRVCRMPFSRRYELVQLWAGSGENGSAATNPKTPAQTCQPPYLQARIVCANGQMWMSALPPPPPPPPPPPSLLLLLLLLLLLPLPHFCSRR